MALDCHERKTLLYSDLFKCHRNKVLEKEQQNNAISKLEEGSSSSSSSNQSSPCDSSSSGFSTPLYSDLGSFESEDGDFIAELTRQMAECMLQEEEENTVVNYVCEDSEASSPVKNNNEQSYVHSGAIHNLENGIYSSPVCVDDRIPPIQVYQLKNQPPVSKQGPVCRGRRVKGTESAQQKQVQKTEQHYVQYRKTEWGIGHGRNGHSGSGMQAVFLGGSGSRSGSPGTGVFWPRVTSDPTELKKKPGCSMVLMPTRVLQALELHFNRRHDSTVPPLLSGGSPNHSCPKDESTTSNGLRNGHSQLENRPANHDEMQLPQEWTY
ncbi:hypothetical protein Pfo_018220 [Paulownia fortunei]|nr:hypothetical protein Pfo_018220 [Paulownia fortunei]